MSYIDALDHDILPSILNIETYYLKQEDTRMGAETTASSYTILIGGGSGEHSIAVVNDNFYCILTYICEILDLKDEDTINENYKELNDWINVHYLNHNLTKPAIDFSNWTLKECADFHNYITHDCMEKRKYPDLSSEKFTYFKVGELLCNRFPYWVPDIVKKYLPLIR